MTDTLSQGFITPVAFLSQSARDSAPHWSAPRAGAGGRSAGGATAPQGAAPGGGHRPARNAPVVRTATKDTRRRRTIIDFTA